MTKKEKGKSFEEIKKEINYLFSKINWGASFLDADAVRIMNEFVSDTEKLIERSAKINHYRN